MIDVLDDLLADDVRKLLQVQDIAAGVVDLSGHHDVEDVVVAVQIDAFPEQPPVLVI